MPTLSEKLNKLGVKVGMQDLPKSEPASRFEIDQVLDGSFRQTRLGEAFVVQQIFTQDYKHGLASIRPESPLSSLADWANSPLFKELPLESYAFLDTETSGLAGGTGTYAFLIGVGRFTKDSFVLEQFFMRDPAEESRVLEALAEFLAPMQALITFNGKAFDVPLLSTRFLLHEAPIPFTDFAHLDLLPLARRLWRDRLPSRALKFLEENVLSAPRTMEDVPGYEIPYLYFDYLNSRDARPLKGVFYHNAMDVVAMAALLTHIIRIIADPFSEMIEHGLDVVALAKWHEELGQWDMAARLFERGLEMNLPEEDFWLAIQRLSQLQKRRGDLETAVKLWERAADRGHIYAHVELAKYYEHRRRNFQEAMKWTKSAMELVNVLDIPRYIYNHWIEELTHRKARLEEKIRRES